MHRLIFTDKTFENVGVEGVIKKPNERDRYKFTLTAPYADIVAYFVDDAQYTWEYDTKIDGVPDVVSHDMYVLGFIKAMDIVDKRDGTFWVYMGKETDKEILARTQTALDSAMAALGEVL